jgi:hypothetical protein
MAVLSQMHGPEGKGTLKRRADGCQTTLATLPRDDVVARAMLGRARRRLMRRDCRLAVVVKALGPCAYNRRPGGFATLFDAIVGGCGDGAWCQCIDGGAHG